MSKSLNMTMAHKHINCHTVRLKMAMKKDTIAIDANEKRYTRLTFINLRNKDMHLIFEIQNVTGCSC